MEYSIGEVAKILGVSPESLRSWEKQKLIPVPKRRITNTRRYTSEEIEVIRRFLANRQSSNKN